MLISRLYEFKVNSQNILSNNIIMLVLVIWCCVKPMGVTSQLYKR